MRRLFLRLYLTVGVAALLTALGMITLASLPRIRHGLGLPRGESGEGPARPPHAGRSPRGDVAEERAVAFVRETARRLQAGEPAPEVLAAARPWVGESVHVAPLARLDVHGRDRTRLARGEVVMTGPPYARRALLLVPESDRVVVGRLPPPEPPPLGGHVLGTLLLMAFAALGLTLALWPLRRQLVHLADTSERFIGGDLGARVELSGADAMQDIAKAFNGMAARSEELLERHRELLQSVSHEMRTPVARLLFAIEQLAEEVPLASGQSAAGTFRQMAGAAVVPKSDLIGHQVDCHFQFRVGFHCGSDAFQVSAGSRHGGDAQRGAVSEENFRV